MEPIKVYLLGTFHFAQADTNVYDVRQEKHQQSIQQLAKMISAQTPDKVFIERMPEWENENRLDSFYQLYRKGDLRRARNEVWQVAARVAHGLNHPHLYQCDHPGQYGYYYSQLEEYATAHGQADRLNYKGKGITEPLTNKINGDSLRNAWPLLDYLQWLNSKEVLQTSHAHYINVYPQVGNVDVFHYDSTYLLGAELTADWYRRNIMIYTKIINQLDYDERAIFLIIGNDHVPILRDLFNGNPYFEVITTDKWLGNQGTNQLKIKDKKGVDKTP